MGMSRFYSIHSGVISTRNNDCSRSNSVSLAMVKPFVACLKCFHVQMANSRIETRIYGLPHSACFSPDKYILYREVDGCLSHFQMCV